jgi:hypothetical protein
VLSTLFTSNAGVLRIRSTCGLAKLYVTVERDYGNDERLAFNDKGLRKRDTCRRGQEQKQNRPDAEEVHVDDVLAHD